MKKNRYVFIFISFELNCKKSEKKEENLFYHFIFVKKTIITEYGDNLVNVGTKLLMTTFLQLRALEH
jgi:hypothetical protein